MKSLSVADELKGSNLETITTNSPTTDETERVSVTKVVKLSRQQHWQGKASSISLNQFNHEADVAMPRKSEAFVIRLNNSEISLSGLLENK